MKKVLNVLGNLVLAVCVLLLSAIFLAPSLFDLTFNTILSSSMEPAIGTGAVVAIARVPPKEIQPGDVISFKMEEMDTPICHRVMEIKETEEGIGFLTKGDANEQPDDWIVGPENLIGRVAFHLPGVGYVAKFVKTPSGFALLMGMPGLLIVIVEVKEIFWPSPARRERVRLRAETDRFPAYLVLLVGLMLIGVLGGMMAGNVRERTLGSFAQETTGDNQTLYVSERIVQNRGILPLVICFCSPDEGVAFGEAHFRLSPGSQKKVEISGTSQDGMVRTGGFFPLLPQGALHWLFRRNGQLAPFVAVAVWILPVSLMLSIILGRLGAEPRLAQRIRRMKRRR